MKSARRICFGVILLLCTALALCGSAADTAPPAEGDYPHTAVEGRQQPRAESRQSITLGDYTLSVSGGEATITAWNGETRYQPIELIIPPEIGGYSVVAIGESAFYGCNGYYGLSSLTLPYTLKTIGSEAFCSTRCKGPVTIPASVELIGDYAFAYMNDVPEFRVERGNANYASRDGVLYDAGIKTLLNYPQGRADEIFAVPGSVTKLFCTSFANSGIKTLLAPSTDIEAMGYTFYGCTMDVYGVPGTWLERMINEEWISGNLTFHDISGYDGPTALSINASSLQAFYIDGLPFKTFQLLAAVSPAQYEYSALTWHSSDTSVATVDGGGLISITGRGSARITAKTANGLSAYFDVSITRLDFDIVLPSELMKIERSAFEGDSAVTSVMVRGGEGAEIGENAFGDCPALSFVYIGPNVTRISDTAFSGCPRVVILCEEGSAAKRYALDNGLRYMIR